MPEVATGMSLKARAAAFLEALDSIEVTDREGGSLDLEQSLRDVVQRLSEMRARRGGVFVAGNGGSAAVAGHAVTDFLNVGGLRAQTLHDSSLLTCMANDYGYEVAFARILSTLAQPGDALILISSSGKSPNVCNAAEAMRKIGGAVVTLSGFASDNRLRGLGDVNFWVDSRDYGMVEIGHQFILHNLSDRMLENTH